MERQERMNGETKRGLWTGMTGVPYSPTEWMTPPGSAWDPRGPNGAMPFLPPALMYQPMADTWRPGFGMPMPYPGPSMINPYGFSAMPMPLPTPPGMGYPGSFLPMTMPAAMPPMPAMSGIPTPAELAPTLLRNSLNPYGARPMGLPNQSFQNVSYNNMPGPSQARALPFPPQQPMLPPGLMPPQAPLAQAANPTPPASPLTPPAPAANPTPPANPAKDLEKAIKEETSKNTPTGFSEEVVHSLNERLNDVSNVENRRAASIEFYNMLEANPALGTDPKYKPYVDAFLFKILKDTDSLVHVGALLALQLKKVQDISPEVADRLKELEHGGGMFKEEEPWAHQVLEGSHVLPTKAMASHTHPAQKNEEAGLAAEALPPEIPEPNELENSTPPDPRSLPASKPIEPSSLPNTAGLGFPQATLPKPDISGFPARQALPTQPAGNPQLDLLSAASQLPPTPQVAQLSVPGQQLNLLSATGEGSPSVRRDGS